MDATVIVQIVILIFSVVIHEMAHGYAANALGDPTARLMGRLSPNPAVHLDPLMSVIVPGLLILSGSPIVFGAAKPVPYNPYNFTNQRWGEALVAAAGPASNIGLAVIFGLVYRFGDVLPFMTDTFASFLFYGIIINIFLAFFNLVPVPPLDGSKILPKLLPFDLAMKYNSLRLQLEQNVMLSFLIVVAVFYYILAEPLFRLTLWFAQLITGGF